MDVLDPAHKQWLTISNVLYYACNPVTDHARDHSIGSESPVASQYCFIIIASLQLTDD